MSKMYSVLESAPSGIAFRVIDHPAKTVGNYIVFSISLVIAFYRRNATSRVAFDFALHKYTLEVANISFHVNTQRQDSKKTFNTIPNTVRLI
jgi:hypothetical protein